MSQVSAAGDGWMHGEVVENLRKNESDICHSFASHERYLAKLSLNGRKPVNSACIRWIGNCYDDLLALN